MSQKNVQYVYYDAVSGQVMAEFSTPKLSVQANWEAKGFLRGVVPGHLRATRDTRIVQVDSDGVVLAVAPSVNPIQPTGPE